jgi:hypothetical protein
VWFLEYFPPLVQVILEVDFVDGVGVEDLSEKRGKGEKYSHL